MILNFTDSENSSMNISFSHGITINRNMEMIYICLIKSTFTSFHFEMEGEHSTLLAMGIFPAINRFSRSNKKKTWNLISKEKQEVR